MMSTRTEMFLRIKTAVGGNREVTGYEYTFGMPKELQEHITPPSYWNDRILSELEFALQLDEGERFGKQLDEALQYLSAHLASDGALCDSVCKEAEGMLMPLAQEAKTYQVTLAAHAHIDMNWMWNYQETVASVLATFRTMLTLMEEYPDFHYSQSQAAVYHIVEEHDPDMMEEIRERIAQGRWEVTASAWVEADHNMPSTESMLRHVEVTRRYLSEKWGVQDFDLDFSPDTFGHNANLPEIDTFAGIQFFYHCRGLKEDYILYRYRAASGKELLTYREPFWYNAAVTPHMGIAAPLLARRCAGLRHSLALYGVGDHGGGPTRRDLNRALDMMQWPVFPQMTFGRIRDFFIAAQAVREKLPVVDHEVNFFAPGCYTTQSRIKRGNRRMEVTLTDAEGYAVAAQSLSGFHPQFTKLEDAWRNVLFTHFHDLLPGSCVQESREHAMGLFQQSAAIANTQCSLALQALCRDVDTSCIAACKDDLSQSEGAGAGYHVKDFSGMPCPERGNGLTRIFHVFNPLPVARKTVVELTAWDWLGDLKRVQMADEKGAQLPCQVLDHQLQKYWDHQYFRFLTEVEIPAMGFATVVLSQREMDSYPLYMLTDGRTAGFYDPYTLDNGRVHAVLDAASGRITSLQIDGSELIKEGKSAGFTLIDTEKSTSSAWRIGRYIKDTPVTQCVDIRACDNGPLRQSVVAQYRIASSQIDVTYILDSDAAFLRMDVKIDWHEIGGETVPVLDYRVPLSYTPNDYLYDIAAGSVRRPAMANDVPALQYGLAARQQAPCAILMSDCKYGYRGEKDTLALSLINSTIRPDPYPERGIHQLSLALGGCGNDPAEAEQTALCFTHGVTYQSGTVHAGVLPATSSFLSLAGEGVVFSSLQLDGKDAFRVRMYNCHPESRTASLTLCQEPETVQRINAIGESNDDSVVIGGKRITLTVQPNALAELSIRLKKPHTK